MMHNMLPILLHAKMMTLTSNMLLAFKFFKKCIQQQQLIILYFFVKRKRNFPSSFFSEKSAWRLPSGILKIFLAF